MVKCVDADSLCRKAQAPEKAYLRGEKSMIRTKLLAAACLVAAILILSPLSHAQTTVLFNGVGSSAAFNAMALAAGGTVTSPGGVCGGNGVSAGGNWTLKNGAMGVDGRSTQIGAVTGNVWIVWNGAAAAGTSGGIVCAYLNIDSVVGNRLYFASPRGTLSIPSSEIGQAGGNLVPILPPDTPLPSNVYTALNNQPFNAAPSDIRPEDAAFATTRALAALTTNRSGLGYGPGPIGATILSEFSSKSTQVVAFNISGTDPITSQPIPTYTTTNVGGQVQLVLLNTTLGGVGSGNFGDPAFDNVDRFVLARYLNGTFTRTRDMIPSSGFPDVPVHVLLREPLSGTMNTIEACIPRNLEIGLSQEDNVNPAVDNPLNQTSTDGGTRQRVIGTGEMVSETGSIGNALGYAFFSFGNVAADVSTARYVTVDGVDPLFASYTGGTLPTCTAPCPGQVTFNHVIDGSYPIWNVLRVTTAHPIPAGIASLISAAQTQVANIPDFVPYSSLQVFRSHFTQDGVPGHNGHIARSQESGGDMGGAVLTVQADDDNITDTGHELTGLKQ
jgi:hypothetical protein